MKSLGKSCEPGKGTSLAWGRTRAGASGIAAVLPATMSPPPSPARKPRRSMSPPLTSNVSGRTLWYEAGQAACLRQGGTIHGAAREVFVRIRCCEVLIYLHWDEASGAGAAREADRGGPLPPGWGVGGRREAGPPRSSKLLRGPGDAPLPRRQRGRVAPEGRTPLRLLPARSHWARATLRPARRAPDLFRRVPRLPGPGAVRPRAGSLERRRGRGAARSRGAGTPPAALTWRLAAASRSPTSSLFGRPRCSAGPRSSI